MSEIPSGHYGLNTIEDVFPKLTQLTSNTNTDSGNYGRASVMTNAGEYIFIGDPDSQTVHVFTSDATSVSSHSTFSNTSVNCENFGQSIDTDLYGSNVVVGGTNHASVWSLNGSGTAFTETVVVTKSTIIGGSGNGTDDFGRCVAMAKENNAWFAVGDYSMNNNQGRINLFEGGTQKAWYGGPSGPMPTKTGFSIGISGDGQYVITGNPGVPANTNQPWGTDGSVSIHKYNASDSSGGGWNYLPTIKVFNTSELGTNVSAGYSVAMSTVNNIVAIGCPFANFTSHPKSGAIHLYQKSATSDSDWNKLGDTINHSNGAGNFVRLTYNGRRLLASLEQAPFLNSATRPKTFQIYDFNDLFWSVLEYIEGEFVDDTYGYPTSMSLEGTRLVLSGKNDTTTGFITGMGKSKIMKIPPTVKTMGNTSVGGTVSCKDIVIGGGVVSTDKHSGMIVFSDTTGDEDKIAKILNRKYDGLNASNDGSELLFMKNGDSTGNKPDRIRIYGNQVVLQGGGSLTETDPNNEVFEDGYEFMCDPALTVSDTNVVNVGLNTGTIDFKVKYISSKFEINGKKDVGLRLHKGVTYKFDQSDSSNSNHRLKFVNDTLNNTTDGINQTLSGTPGSSGAYTQVTFTSDASSYTIKIFDSVNDSGTSYTSSNIDINIPSVRLNVTGNSYFDTIKTNELKTNELNLLNYHPLTALYSANSSGYIASSSSNLTDWDAWKAFNGTVVGNGWHDSGAPYSDVTRNYLGSISTSYSGGSVSGEWIQLQLPYKVSINSIEIAPRQETYGPNRCAGDGRLLGSIDGTSWESVHSFTGQTYYTGGLYTTISFSDSNMYNYYRLVITRLSGSAGEDTVNIGEIKLGIANSGIHFSKNTGSVSKITSSSAGDDLRFYSDKWIRFIESDTNAEKLVINGNEGKIGINHSTPDSCLHIASSSGQTITLDNTTRTSYIHYVRGNGHWYTVVDNNGNYDHNMYWYANATTDGGANWSIKQIFRFENNTAGAGSNAIGTFTGQHMSSIVDVTPTNVSNCVGLIVSSNQNDYMTINGGTPLKGAKNIHVNEAIPVVKISTKAQDKACFGVISSGEDSNESGREQRTGRIVGVFHKESGDNRVYVNSLGEGGVWVVNTNGNLEAGDYITTSNVSGYGMKQTSEFLANYTVAKITMDCNFNPGQVPVKQIKKVSATNTYYVRSTDNDTCNETFYNTLDDETKALYTRDVRTEMVNDLDSNGVFQWEDTSETELAYTIRYLDADGIETTQGNAVHIAAFVGCTYHCG